MSLRWRAARADDLVWVEFGDGCAVHHRPSGKTHFVNAATAYLLRDVLAVPGDAGDIRRALGFDSSREQGAPAQDEIDELLPRLESLGLVSREP